MAEDFSQDALVLFGHGSTRNADSGRPVFQHANELRRSFGEVQEAFWKQEPLLLDVLPALTASRVFLVPLFISEGYFSEEVIPRALGFGVGAAGVDGRVRRRGKQALVYCRPVGSHPHMTTVLLARAVGVLQQFPFPRPPKPSEIALFIAGHGTEQSDQSRAAVELQVERIRAQGLYASVDAVYIEEEPRISSCYQTARTKHIVVLPFFISDGLHVREDIPVLLSEPAHLVQQRLRSGQATWRNPSEKKGKLVWVAPAVGTHPLMTEVILARVHEAATWIK